MNAQKLVKMVNDISTFFEAEPDRAAALQSVAGHIKRFWDPRMRKDLLRWVDDHGGEGLRPVALEAIKAHRSDLAPPEEKAS